MNSLIVRATVVLALQLIPGTFSVQKLAEHEMDGVTVEGPASEGHKTAHPSKVSEAKAPTTKASASKASTTKASASKASTTKAVHSSAQHTVVQATRAAMYEVRSAYHKAQRVKTQAVNKLRASKARFLKAKKDVQVETKKQTSASHGSSGESQKLAALQHRLDEVAKHVNVAERVVQAAKGKLALARGRYMAFMKTLPEKLNVHPKGVHSKGVHPKASKKSASKTPANKTGATKKSANGKATVAHREAVKSPRMLQMKEMHMVNDGSESSEKNPEQKDLIPVGVPNPVGDVAKNSTSEEPLKKSVVSDGGRQEDTGKLLAQLNEDSADNSSHMEEEAAVKSSGEEPGKLLEALGQREREDIDRVAEDADIVDAEAHDVVEDFHAELGEGDAAEEGQENLTMEEVDDLEEGDVTEDAASAAKADDLVAVEVVEVVDDDVPTASEEEEALEQLEAEDAEEQKLFEQYDIKAQAAELGDEGYPAEEEYADDENEIDGMKELKSLESALEARLEASIDDDDIEEEFQELEEQQEEQQVDLAEADVEQSFADRAKQQVQDDLKAEQLVYRDAMKSMSMSPGSAAIKSRSEGPQGDMEVVVSSDGDSQVVAPELAVTVYETTTLDPTSTDAEELVEEAATSTREPSEFEKGIEAWEALTDQLSEVATVANASYEPEAAEEQGTMMLSPELAASINISLDDKTETPPVTSEELGEAGEPGVFAEGDGALDGEAAAPGEKSTEKKEKKTWMQWVMGKSSSHAESTTEPSNDMTTSGQDLEAELSHSDVVAAASAPFSWESSAAAAEDAYSIVTETDKAEAMTSQDLVDASNRQAEEAASEASEVAAAALRESDVEMLPTTTEQNDSFGMPKATLDALYQPPSSDGATEANPDDEMQRDAAAWLVGLTDNEN